MNFAQLLAQILQIIPIIDGLISVIQKVKDQTETQNPEIWNQVKGDWNAAVARWNAVIGPPTP